MKELIAKSNGETLELHTRKTMEITHLIIDRLPKIVTIEDLLKMAEECAAFHDTGKAAEGCQRMLRKEERSWGGKRHEVLSAAFMSSFQNIREEQVLAVITHHRSIQKNFLDVSGEYLNFDMDVDTTAGNFKSMVKEWNQNHNDFIFFWEKIQSFLHEIQKISDISMQISINELWWNGRDQKKLSVESRYLASLLRGILMTADHLASAGVEPKKIPELRKYDIGCHSLYPFQHRLSETEGNVVLMAPTGSGKTEAALLWAGKNQLQNGRLFYVLPYTASINAMYKRLIKVYDETVVGILHSRIISFLYSVELESIEDVNSIEAQRKAALLTSLCREAYHPIKVCTVHQILRLILKDKGWEQSLMEYPGACFIFDEIHAYDPVITGLTLATARLLVRWKARCIFMSATMPSFLRELIFDAVPDAQLISPSDVGADKEINDRKRHTLNFISGNMFENIEWLNNELMQNESNLIVCNHVLTAQKLYKKLKDNYSLNDVLLFHSKFNRNDRAKIEKRLFEKKLPKILVATQVVEVSLHIDFARGFLEPAPIDALVQRMGRINRSGRQLNPAQITVLREQVGKYPIYSHERTKRTLDVLEKLPLPISEKDIVEAANVVYENGYNDSELLEYRNAYNHPDILNYEQELVAGTHCNWVKDVLERTDQTVEVLPLKFLEEYKRLKNVGLWIEANNLLVPLRVNSKYSYGNLLNLNNDPPTIAVEYDERLGLVNEAMSNFIE